MKEREGGRERERESAFRKYFTKVKEKKEKNYVIEEEGEREM